MKVHKGPKDEVESPEPLPSQHSVIRNGGGRSGVKTRQPDRRIHGTPPSGSKKGAKQAAAEASEQGERGSGDASGLSDARILPHAVKPEEIDEPEKKGRGGGGGGGGDAAGDGG